jgi:hypothetical protein
MSNFAMTAPFSALYAAPTATKKAAIGQLAQDPEGGLWRYFYAGGTLTDLLGAGCYAQPVDCTPYATDAGSWTLKVTETTCAKNRYANGTITLVCATGGYRYTYHIKSNTVSTGVYTILTLQHPVRTAIVATDYATLEPNRFVDVRSLTAAGAGGMSVVCMPLQAVTATYYAWGKTRGMCYGIPIAGAPGAGARERAITFGHGDGSLRVAAVVWNAGFSDQYAGYLVPRTDTYGGDQSFMLQLE